MSDPRADKLISKVIDGDVTESQWNDLATMAEADPQIWRDLAESQHDQQVLSRAVNAAVRVAERVPALASAVPDADASGGRRLHSASAWSGWVVAAVVALAALAGRFGQTTQVADGPQQASLFQVGTPDEAFDAYLDLGMKDGSVVGELPSQVIVSSEELPAGQGFKLVCLRQVVVQVVVPDLYKYVGTDDTGQLTLARHEPSPSGM